MGICKTLACFQTLRPPKRGFLHETGFFLPKLVCCEACKLRKKNGMQIHVGIIYKTLLGAILG